MDCACQFSDTSSLHGTCSGDANMTMFMSLVQILIRSSCPIAEPCQRFEKLGATNGENYDYKNNKYDFIVVGGGVGGSVMAGRLSENKKWRVGLFEAGPEEPTVSTVPAFSNNLIGSEMDWKYETEKQSTACLSTDGKCSWPRGKVLGGTGTMTGMMYMRGSKEIFDSWAAEGNVGWSYYEVLPFFKKSENNKNPDIIEPAFHGRSGPMPVQRFPYRPWLTEDIINAGKELGLLEQDLNGRNQTGIAIAQVMVDDGFRASTPRMYLRPHRSRKNLYVHLNCRVTKVIINRVSKKAIGIEYYTQTGERRVAYATKEVILSAGAVGSPHLLLLSGVGPKEDLEKHGIHCIQDLKVGHNLQNHVAALTRFSVKDPGEELLTYISLNQYLVNRTGPLSSTGLTQLTAFIHSQYSPRIPDIQLFFDGFKADCPDRSSTSSNEKRRIIGIRPTNTITFSRGRLTLNSSNPFDNPLIYSNYLSDEQDVKVLLDGIKFAIKLAETQTMKKWDMKLITKPLEGCSTYTFGSDEYWICVIRTYTGAENHPAGTCKMGVSMNHGAVVDPELRVHGIPSIRVVDASIFPLNPNGNPIPAILMAAEKASHLIQQSWASC